MSRRFVSVSLGLCLIASIAGGNWIETFNAGNYDLPDWNFHCYPDVTKTYTHTLTAGSGDNFYLTLDESSSVKVYGSAFGAAIPGNESFTDVRMGAVVNMGADASRSYHGFAARTDYFISPGQPYSPAPGFIAKSTYVMLINWDAGPTNVRLEVQKVVLMQNIMAKDYEVTVPGVLNQRSFYAELDIVGSGPVYITGSLYAYKGGPLVARTPTLIDTNAKDDWEENTQGQYDAVFPAGISAIFAMNEHEEPAGYHVSFDDICSLSDGPAAVGLGPADGASGVSLSGQTLTWVEPAYATSRVLWFGKAGSMSRFTPTGTSFDTGVLEAGKTYQWRVDMVGPSGIVEGRTQSFTTADSIPFEDFETYTDDRSLRLVWDPNTVPDQPMDPNSANSLETTTAGHGTKSMKMEVMNREAPYYRQYTRTLNPAQDWTANGIKALSLSFRGKSDNAEQPIFVKLFDAEGHFGTAALPAYASQTTSWNPWTIDLSTIASQGVNLAAIAKISVGVGGTASSGQGEGDIDTVWVDDLRFYQARCFNTAGLGLYSDANGDCRVDLEDFATLAAEWLNNGLSVTP